MFLNPLGVLPGFSFGVLRTSYAGKENSASAFVKAKLHPVGLPPAGAAWAPTAHRWEVLLPRDGGDDLLDPRRLIELYESTALPWRQGLLATMKLSFGEGDRLHVAYERGRAKSVMEGVGLGVNEWRVIYTIARSHPAFTASDIGRRLGLPRQTIQRIADNLEGRGLLEFKSNPDHKKASILALTEAGRSVYAVANGRQYGVAQWLTQDLSEAEMATTLGLFQKLEHRLGQAIFEMLSEAKFPPPGR